MGVRSSTILSMLRLNLTRLLQTRIPILISNFAFKTLEDSSKTNRRGTNSSYLRAAGSLPWSQGQAERGEDVSILWKANTRRSAYTCWARDQSVPSWLLLLRTSSLLLVPRSVIYTWSYDSYHPLQKIKFIGYEAKRQSLCIDVIFQGNNS